MSDDDLRIANEATLELTRRAAEAERHAEALARSLRATTAFLPLFTGDEKEKRAIPVYERAHASLVAYCEHRGIRIQDLNEVPS